MHACTYAHDGRGKSWHAVVRVCVSVRICVRVELCGRAGAQLDQDRQIHESNDIWLAYGIAAKKADKRVRVA